MSHNSIDHYGAGSYHQTPPPVASPMHAPPVMDPSNQGYQQDSSYNYGYNPPYNPSNLGYHQAGQPPVHHNQPPVHHGQPGGFMQVCETHEQYWCQSIMAHRKVRFLPISSVVIFI